MTLPADDWTGDRGPQVRPQMEGLQAEVERAVRAFCDRIILAVQQQAAMLEPAPVDATADLTAALIQWRLQDLDRENTLAQVYGEEPRTRAQVMDELLTWAESKLGLTADQAAEVRRRVGE